MMELFEYILIALACPLLLPFWKKSNKSEISTGWKESEE